MSELTVAGASEQDMRLREAASHGAEGLERRLTIALGGGVLLVLGVVIVLIRSGRSDPAKPWPG